MSRLRICVISSYPPVKGGEATYTRDFVQAMINYFPTEIDKIHVLSHSESISPHKCEQDSKIEVIRVFNSCSFWSRNFAFLRIWFRILGIRPNIIHLQYSTIPNGRYGGLLGESLFVLQLLLKPLRIPFYVTQHSAWLPRQAQERIFEKTRSQFLSIIGREYLNIFTHFFAKLPNKLFLLVNVKNSVLTQKFSESFRIPRFRIEEELHGVWRNEDDMEINRKENSKKIVCLGVLNPSKGYEVTIMAMNIVLTEYPDASLVIAGSPPPTNFREGKKYIDRLRKIISENNLGNAVTIIDRYISDEEFKEFIKTAGVVVLPYSQVVGASGIMHMAMRYGVPLIVAGSGLLFEEIAHIVPVVPPHDPQQLAEKIIRTFSNNTDNTILVERYKQYLEDHDWSIVSKGIYEVYIRGLRVR